MIVPPGGYPMPSLRTARAVVAAAAFAAAPAAAQTPAVSPPPSAANTISVTFVAQSNSGETGIGMLSPAGDTKTKIVIALHGAPEGEQPMRIHAGSCSRLDDRDVYTLKDATSGKSTTVLDVPFAKLTGGGYAIGVYKSASALDTVVSCGEIKKQ
jgi:hypothetical protein